MPANRLKQNIRVQRSHERQHKKKYKGLSAQQKTYIKAKETYDQAERELNRFWSSAPRHFGTGPVNWSLIPPEQIESFEHISCIQNQAFGTMRRLEEAGLDTEYTLMVFRAINNHSESY